MNDDFKEELKDCYAEIERLSEANTQVWADNERLRAALDTVRASGLLIGSTTLHDRVRSAVYNAIDANPAAMEVHSIGHEDGLCPRERA